MSHSSPTTTRRQALKFLGAPLILPLGSLSTAALSACGGGDDDAPAVDYVSASFAAMAAPSLAGAAAMATTTVASSLDVSLSDGTTQSYKLAYQPFFMTGDMLPDGKGGTLLAGGYVDI